MNRIIGGGAHLRQEVPGYSPRVVVKFRDRIGLPYDDRVADNLERREIGPWRRLAEQFPGISMRRLVSAIEPEEIRQLVARAVRQNPSYRPPDFFSYFVIDVPVDVNVEGLVEEVSSWQSVETAYFDPPGEDPQLNANDPQLRNPGHLDPAPIGIDARFAWTRAGGKGEAQQIVDIEKGWTLDHQDIAAHGATLMCGDNLASSHPHGTNVLGVMCATHEKIGGLGIAPEVATVQVMSHRGMCGGALLSLPDAIAKAIINFPPCGVLLLEVQESGLPAEALLGNYDYIRLATEAGIIVIEPAGNGGMFGVDLDKYDDAGKRILNRKDINFRGDSGAIMVAAATSMNPHSRMKFSNYGNRVDCFAWGENVCCATSTTVTPFSKNEYRGDFGGTSSASAIIAGAALLVQGMAEESLGRNKRKTPLQMRALLSNPANGTASDDPLNFPIGVMPDLRAIKDSGAIG